MNIWVCFTTTHFLLVFLSHVHQVLYSKREKDSLWQKMNQYFTQRQLTFKSHTF